MDTITAEALTAGLQETWESPVGESATATVGDWTVEVSGHARQHGWPQPMPVPVTLKHRGSPIDQAKTTGQPNPQSWEDFTALLILLDDERQAREAADSLGKLGQEYREAQVRLDRATTELKDALSTAYHRSHKTDLPLTKYRLAQLSGIPEPTIGRWLK